MLLTLRGRKQKRNQPPSCSTHDHTLPHSFDVGVGKQLSITTHARTRTKHTRINFIFSLIVYYTQLLPWWFDQIQSIHHVYIILLLLHFRYYVVLPNHTINTITEDKVVSSILSKLNFQNKSYLVITVCNQHTRKLFFVFLVLVVTLLPWSESAIATSTMISPQVG